jgi:hypothetical protein
MQLSTLLKDQDKISLHYSKELWSTEGIVTFDGEELVIEITNVMIVLLCSTSSIVHRFGRYMIQWSATQLHQWHLFESIIDRELEEDCYRKLSDRMPKRVNVEMLGPSEQRETYNGTVQLSYRILLTTDKDSNSIVRQKVIVHKFTELENELHSTERPTLIKKKENMFSQKRKRSLPSKLPSVDKLFEETSDYELSLRMAAFNPLTSNTTLETYYDSFMQQIPFGELDKFQKCLWFQLWKQSQEKIKLPCDDSDDETSTRNDYLLRKRLRKKKEFLETLREEIHDPVGPQKNVKELLNCAEINRVIYPFDGSEEEYMFSINVHVDIEGNWHEVDFECFVKLSMKDYCKLKLWYCCDDENPTTMTSIHPCVVDIDLEVNEHFVSQFLSFLDVEPDVGKVIESDVEVTQ